MSISAIFVLAGQTVQIVAGFILSVEVIGLKRVDRWSRWLSILHKDVATDRPHPFSSRGTLIRSISVGLITGALLILTFHLQSKFNLLQDWSVYMQAAIFGVVGAFVGGTFWQTLLLTLRLTAKGLRAIHARSRARTSGILGFLLLLLGFLLEFGGTLAQSLKK